jgi:UPF0755 protein
MTGEGTDEPWPPVPGTVEGVEASAPAGSAGVAEEVEPSERSRNESSNESSRGVDESFLPRRREVGEGPPSRRERAARRREEQQRRRRRRWLVLGVLAVLVLPFVIAAGWFAWQMFPPGGEGDPVIVTVQSGWGAKEIGDELAAKDVVGSSLAFQVWFRVSGGSARAGAYDLHQDMGVKSASDALERGPSSAAGSSEHQELALPPGLRLEQIADRVGALPGHDRAAFLALAQSGTIRSKYQGDQTSVEGFTFPATYFVEGLSDEQILRTIVGEFDKRADALGLANATAATGLTPQQTVVVASLVQAEAGTPEDAPKIAAVVRNRLRQGMPLQIDATLCYAKGGCPPVPSNADKQIDSPYNTYRVNGLPPTPIMTVTEQSLRAALAPANVPYLFYVTGKDGVTYYATTLAEHEANIKAHGVRGE